jgi:dTDP-glucose 4,6-dehydratase
MSTNQFSILKDKQVLITGGCGFIGSEITKQLSNIGAKITIVDNLSSGKEEYVKRLSNVTLIKGDLSNTELVRDAVKNKEYVIHLAALPFIPDSYYYPMEFFDVNVNSTITLALAVIKEKTAKRFVHISSSEIYGSSRYTPMDENHPTTPHSTYAVSKLAGERVVYTMHKEHDLPAVIIRPFNSFGPNITQPYVIPEIIGQLLKGNKEITLGNIHSKRDLTFVSDTARGIILSLIMDGIIGETINIGSERSIAVKELVKMISDLTSTEVTVKIDPSRFRPYDVDSLVCDYGRATRLLGWKPEVNIKDGLRMTIEWMKNNNTELKAPFKGWAASYRKDRNGLFE